MRSPTDARVYQLRLPTASPLYNRNGWLGVKHQVTYLLQTRSPKGVWVFQMRSPTDVRFCVCFKCGHQQVWGSVYVSDEVTNRCAFPMRSPTGVCFTWGHQQMWDYVCLSDEVTNRCEVLCVFQMRSPTGVCFRWCHQQMWCSVCVSDEVTNRYGVRFCVCFRWGHQQECVSDEVTNRSVRFCVCFRWGH